MLYAHCWQGLEAAERGAESERCLAAAKLLCTADFGDGDGGFWGEGLKFFFFFWGGLGRQLDFSFLWGVGVGGLGGWGVWELRGWEVGLGGWVGVFVGLGGCDGGVGDGQVDFLIESHVH